VGVMHPLLFFDRGRYYMNSKLKHVLEFLGVALITFVLALSSPLNPLMNNAFTDIQNEILDIAHQVRDGYLAYVELPGHYGPVVYEGYGLGYLLTDTHIVQFIMECVILFFAVLFLYKTAKLYTSPVFAMISAGLLSIISWGQITHAGAEEIAFFILSITGYHVARQLTSGFLSHHSYLLAVDLGLIIFLQTGCVFYWVVLVIFFAVKFKIDGIGGKEYKSFWLSTLEGLVTVGLPMGIYLWYFKNAAAFMQNVFIYNITSMGSFAEGLKAVLASPWTFLVILFIVLIIIKFALGQKVTDLCCWLGLIIVALVVFSLQGDNLASYATLAKALYIVPLATVFSFLDKPLGLKAEEIKYGVVAEEE